VNDQACLARSAADQGAAQQLCGTSVSACVSPCDDDLGSCAIFAPGTEELAVALTTDGQPRKNPFAAFGADAPSAIANAQCGKEADEIQRLVETGSHSPGGGVSPGVRETHGVRRRGFKRRA